MKNHKKILSILGYIFINLILKSCNYFHIIKLNTFNILNNIIRFYKCPKTSINNLNSGISDEDSKLVDSILNDLNNHSSRR